MKTPLNKKSSREEIRLRFDNDVERFSNLKTGQQAVIDAPLMMELITSAAIASSSKIDNVLDIGCGAGNNTLKLLQHISPLNCDLLDLSQPMLARAVDRISKINSGTIRTFVGDMRTIELPEENYDIIIAAAVLHHLREDSDWEQMFARLYSLTAPGGSVWISDMVFHENVFIQKFMWDRYGEYLQNLGGKEYRAKVFQYIDKEDSPRSIFYQMELLKKVGFGQVELLHKNSCVAAFGAIKN
jgi:tRNA (cmo5U34)-methyltransferase